ncbi:hypothetical protein CK203_023952 [Vitis vinifera]|uniref:Uncharacterized protein n=1 Tax=Vitis vinifera TaxID=29760 RepID=A0A438IPP1_VITVI|nr:hypothetical protein CK203_023952 [Vitis vinifera]
MLPHLLDDVNDINSDFGHTTAPQWQPRTNFAFTNNSNTLNWLLDSRVSHHVTSNLSNVSIHPPYDDSDDIVINDDIDSSVKSSPLIAFLSVKTTLFQ